MPRRWKPSLLRAHNDGLPIQPHGEHRSKRGRCKNYRKQRERRIFDRMKEIREVNGENKNAKQDLLNQTFTISSDGSCIQSRNSSENESQ